MTYTHKIMELESAAETEYLDNGGCLTIERRDYYYTKLLALAKEMALHLDARIA